MYRAGLSCSTALISANLTFTPQDRYVVTQDTYLFNATIKENSLYARDGKTGGIEEACRKVNIHDFTMSLPDKMINNRR